MKPGPLRIASVLLAIGMATACSTHGDTDQSAISTRDSVRVTTAMPRQGHFANTIDAFGTIVPDPRRTFDPDLPHAGRVNAIQVGTGQAVHAGDTLLLVATDPTAQRAYAEARNALREARGELARTQQLFGEHLATQSQLAAVRKTLADARAAMQAQRRIGGSRATEAVTAPADGVVTRVLVKRGQYVPAHAPLLSFVPTHGVIAGLWIQPDPPVPLKPGMAVTLHAVYGTHPDTPATLCMVGHALDPQSHLVPVQACLSGKQATPWEVGDALSAHIRTTSFSAWAVPRQALRHDGSGDYLFQLDHGKARRVDVQVRSPGGDVVGVEGRLDPRLPVIVLGAYELADGMAVRGRAS